MSEFAGLLKDSAGDGYAYGTFDKTGIYIYLEVRGFYIKDENPAVTGRRHRFILPLRDDTFATPTDRQEFFTPIKDLFDGISDVIGGLGATWMSGTADLVVKLQDMFGTRLFNGVVHMQAWRHAKPSDLSLKLDFNFGMLDLWDAREEVLQPLLVLKRTSLPSNQNGTYFASGPTALSVYSNFGTSVFNSAVNASFRFLQDAVKGSDPAYKDYSKGRKLEADMAASQGNLNKSSSMIDATIKASGEDGSAFTTRGVWRLALIAHDQINKQQRILFQSPDMVCKSSSISYGNQLDDTLSPISGSCSLELSSQAPTTSEDYRLDGAWK